MFSGPQEHVRRKVQRLLLEQRLEKHPRKPRERRQPSGGESRWVVEGVLCAL